MKDNQVFPFVIPFFPRMVIPIVMAMILGFPMETFGQGRRGSARGPGAKSGALILVGKVLSANEDQVLEYATVSLLLQKDSSLVGGAVTDSKGVFEIEAKAGEYLAKVAFLGYQPQFIANIQLSPENPFVRLKDIRLSQMATTLDDVEIQAERSRLEFALDKKIFNVGQDLANNGGNASDILDNIPSVTVDIEGEVSVRGKQGVRILINGKPSGFTGINSADALKQLPANLIDKVELITNPSARYEAEGSAGIINIVLKKERRKGWNGTFDLTGGWPHSHNAAVNVNHRRDKVNFFFGGGLRYRNTPRQSFEHRETTDSAGVLSILDQESFGLRGGLSGSLRFGADYSIDKFTTLTGSILYRKSADFSNSDIDYLSYTDAYDLLSINARDNDETEDEYSLDYNINFERTFRRKGQKFTADLIFSNGTEAENMNAIEQSLDPNRVPLGLPDLQQRINNSESEREITVIADYVHPIGKDGKFETGYRSSFRDIGNTYLVEELDNESNVWMNLENISNDFSYDEEIHALYAIYGNKIDKFSYQAGIRAEHTQIQTLLETTNERYDKEYLNFFPSAFLNYEFKPGNALQLSFSRRLRRPRFHNLNPFFTYANPLSIRSGNPDLDPEFTNSYEISYIRYFEKATLSTGLYHRHTDGEITYVNELTIDENNQQSVNLSYPENIATRDDVGFEVSLNYSPAKWLDITWSGEVFYGKLVADNLDLDVFREREFFSYTSRLNTKMTVLKDVDIQVMVNYRGPQGTPQGTRESVLYTDLGISKDVLKKKATVSFRISDIFNTAWYRSETSGENFYIYREGQWRARRQAYFSFSYRLNQKKRARRGRQGGGGFDGEPDM